VKIRFQAFAFEIQLVPLHRGGAERGEEKSVVVVGGVSEDDDGDGWRGSL
jgi:hypothetical protein